MKHETVNKYVVKVNSELNLHGKGRQGFCFCKGKDIFFTYRLLAESRTSGWVWYCIPEKTIKKFFSEIAESGKPFLEALFEKCGIYE